MEQDDLELCLSPVSPAFSTIAATTRFGMIALSTDLTSEGDFFRLMPEKGAALHVTRVANENPTTPENLKKWRRG